MHVDAREHEWEHSFKTAVKLQPGEDSAKAVSIAVPWRLDLAARLNGELGWGTVSGAVQVLRAGGKVVKAVLLVVQAAALPPVQAILAAAPKPPTRYLC